MNCIIIDDEATARAIISQLCSNIPTLNVLEEFPNAIQAIKYLNQNEVDLIFLDIHMPDFTGFDFIDTLKNPPKIVLTTSDANFAIQAFEYDCIVDYLVKPVTPQRFGKAIQKANAKSISTPKKATPKTEDSSGDDLYVNIDRRLIKIDIPSIYLVEAKGDYIHVKTETKNYTVHSTLKKIQEKLPENLFLKVHRSYIINVDKIIDIEDNSVLIKKDVIPVSRSNRPELMKRLNLL
ncbi:Two-component transcriptional response regulator, LuxR family [Mesoflavibacter sp. HG96]|uniref:LytR/AlgR family response regulator transcription factor n=1 Tax=Mesoflavibacter TaxID=444051 RepID=UPI000D0F78B2|nr:MULTISPECIES: LytTR family DNA-binding domain-containing protein [Mesoflavibacter]QIJ88558.1 Two-component transcriptional response regulator, LuxR family [Mesoflavibacter sp. HG96]QIJ91286.1 Two-component transcriptional response regulator, LuxR family [Mesoflavibacter sp. HG37]